jgi:hypothetical protein
MNSSPLNILKGSSSNPSRSRGEYSNVDCQENKAQLEEWTCGSGWAPPA